MINSIFCFFAFSYLLQRLWRKRPHEFWVALSVIGLLQVAQSTLWAVFGLLIVQEVLVRVLPRQRFVPLIYAAVLIVLNHVLHWRIGGFSYLVLASSMDLWFRLNGVDLSLKERFLNLVSFPKTAVGPITSADEHRTMLIDAERVAKIAIMGIFKGFILVNMWRMYVPMPMWSTLVSPLDYFWFGLWNYVHLYLEFSGACDLVAATFWLYGFGCPLNFDRPYMALTITEFWKRWHITLGRWIKNFVYIPLGGNRVSAGRIYLNLILAMTLSGLWHGLSLNFLAWGFLQGVFLAIEKAIGLEKFLEKETAWVKGASWVTTQLLVTASWILFFAPLKI